MLFEGIWLTFIFLVVINHLLPLENCLFGDRRVECFGNLALGFTPLPCLLEGLPEVGPYIYTGGQQRSISTT